MTEISTQTFLPEQAQVDGFVRQIFDQLDAAEIEYCLLRGYDELFEPKGYLEIDLLVNPAHLNRIAETTRKLGFVELPSWGHTPHFFFTAFDAKRGNWVKLDVVTELRYGKPIRRFRIPLAKQCLRERELQDVYRLSVENEFVTLLMHCLLDKGRIREAHRGRLAEICQNATETFERRVGKAIQNYFAPLLDWTRIEFAIKDGDWKLLEQKAGDLSRRFAKRDPQSFLRALSTRLFRNMRPLFFAFRRRGHSLALLAPDGAGKSTLARALVGDRILKGRLIYMGTNVKATNVGLPTSEWLHQRRKAIRGKGGALNPFHLAVKAGNFVNNLLESWLRSLTAHYHLLRGRFVIFDRFVYDSWVAKKPKNFIKRIRRLLFEAGLPTPDLVVFLDAPGELLFKRKGEHSPEWLEQQRQSYLALQERIPQMRIVNATNSTETVRNEVIDLIWKTYGNNLNTEGD